MKTLFRLLETIIVFALLGFALAKADVSNEHQCREILTDNYSKESHYVVYNDDLLNLRDYFNDHLAYSIAVVRIVIDKLGCANGSINFGKGPEGKSHSRCQEIVRERDNSRMCYIESNLGYWFVHKDFLNNVHVQFHRWD